MKIYLNSDSNLSLNPIQAEDQPILYALMDEIYREAYRYVWTDQGDWYVNLIYNQHTLYKELKRATSNYFFVEAGERKIGILKYDFPFSPKEIAIPEAMKLHRLYLHSDFQGKGVAKILVDHCERIGQENGLKSIWLEVMSCQPQAKKFYQKMGFGHLLSYQLDFERIIPEYRGIEIWQKSLV
ncbi:GNAT family N-acetyltransferase [Algoriphagus sp. A40]|uniref:GNAT family N-acetyltransferase n=1 Tax=Algoriphagus sp. A40 TaxID=1945863 RepID=UPI000986B30D|nr:GNAT family N-acetyltransferase [Algoriphagus sp. A40]OOG71909.1 hypothetical protein B0E43_16640 [Algoriphagus sp. A40]